MFTMKYLYIYVAVVLPHVGKGRTRSLYNVVIKKKFLLWYYGSKTCL